MAASAEQPVEAAVPGRPYTVLIADDDVNYRAALAAAIEQEPTLELVGVATSGSDAVALALDRSPQVVLVDVRMGGGGGAHVARSLAAAGSAARIVALSAYDDHATVRQMLDAGASAYLLKGSTVDALVAGITRAAAGAPAAAGDLVPAAALRRLQPCPPVRSAEAIRVLLVDDDGALHDELSAGIAAEAGIELVAIAGHLSEAATLAVRHEPHVALVDWRIPGGGVDAVAGIAERAPSTRIVGLSAGCQPQVVMAMLRAGATGFLAKPVCAAQLIEAIRAAARGRMALTPDLSEPVLEQLVIDLQDRSRAIAEETAMRERVRAAMDAPLTMAYQPIFSLREQAPVAVEALARFAAEPHRVTNVWFHEAARCGLVVDLDTMTITKALAALEWLPRDVALHVNVAPETLFAGRAAELLDVFEPDRVVVEITEHSDICDYRHLNRALAPLRESGMRLAVDDVGAGFSSLRHVLVLEPDMIKLDVSLCRGIDSNQVRRALARALTGFGQEVDKMVVAEGVETEGELEALLELGVTHAQGHLLGRPSEGPLPGLTAPV